MSFVSAADTVLRQSLGHLAGRFERGEKPNLGEVLGAFSALGVQSNAFVAVVLALPFLSPLSLGPVTSPASLLILLLGWQLIQHRDDTDSAAARPAGLMDHLVALPGRLVAALLAAWPLRWVVRRLESSRSWVLSAPLPRRVFGLMRHLLEWVLWLKNGVLRLRRALLGHGPAAPATPAGERTARWVCGVAIIVGAVLLAVPVPLLPMTNTFPALGIILVALGWIERDAILTLLGYASYVISVLIFAALALAVAYLGYEAVAEWIPNLLGFGGSTESNSEPASR